MSLVRVVHKTAFTYLAGVTASYNEARMRPVDDDNQTLRSSKLTISPHTWTDVYEDYWGTAVTIFEVLEPHDHLEIVAEATVEVADVVDERPEVEWEELGGRAVLDAHIQYLAATSTTAVPDDVAALALKVAAGLPPGQAAEEICLAVREQLEYVPGVTTVHTPARDAWAARKGVCQDMAHLCIGALRSVGIPARYVSGYLHPQANAAIGVPVLGESHAWLEWWAGRWIAYDPTNRRFAGADHVVVGRGRQYGDVPPLKGVFAGGGTSNLTATVEMTRLA